MLLPAIKGGVMAPPLWMALSSRPSNTGISRALTGKPGAGGTWMPCFL